MRANYARASHAQLVNEAVRQCDQLGLRVFFWPDSRRTLRKGWPDLTIIGRSGVLFREVKTAFGKLTPEQRLTGYEMTRAGLDWAVWRPGDFAAGTAERELRRIAGYIPVS